MKVCDLDLVPGRNCGGCTACCSVMAIDKPEIQKEAGVLCRHCENGCTIYDTRPALCRDYQCGWRQLSILDESWRPDLSGVFTEIEVIDDETVISLVLIGNPLKTVRQEWFIDFIATGVRNSVALHLGLLGPKGYQGASVSLNTRQMTAAAHTARGMVKNELELNLKRLKAHPFEPRMIVHRGNDVGRPA